MTAINIIFISCILWSSLFIIDAGSLKRLNRAVDAPRLLPTECGISSVQTTKIVGGREALLGAWPWVVAVYILGEPDCGGVLISKEHVVTAAHCVVDTRDKPISPSVLRVRAGEHNLDDSVNDGARPQDVDVSEVVSHEGFSFRHVENDIAILKLKTPVGFRKHVRPICLPFSGVFASGSISGEDAYVAGWGVWNLTHRARSSALREVQLPVWKNEECQKVVKVSSDGVFCAGVPAGGKDSCKGDSGGPLMLKDNSDKFYLMGVVSHGEDCAQADRPGVYTNIRHYLQWLSNNIK